MSGVRELPGFYYDTDKKKYFRIQANHVAPPGAKHSVDNVRSERQDAKRRKVTNRRMQQCLNDTIHRARILKDPFSATALNRELGLSNRHDHALAQAHTLARGLRRQCTIDLGGCGECGRRNQCYDFDILHSGNTLACSAGDSSATITIQPVPTTPDDPRSDIRISHLPSEGLSISTSPSHLLIATASIAHGPNLMIAHLPLDPDPPPLVAMHLTLGSGATELLASAANPLVPYSAVVASTIDAAGKAYSLDCTRGDVIASLSAPALRSAAWLGPTTAVLGARSGKVLLWDTRAAGVATRFKHLGEARHVAPLRGHDVWVAGMAGVGRYDTRMGRDPVVRIAETRLAADTQMAVWEEGGLVALAGSSGGILLFEERGGEMLGRMADNQVRADATEDDVEGVCNVGRMRVGEDMDGRMGLWYARGERLYRYSF